MLLMIFQDCNRVYVGDILYISCRNANVCFEYCGSFGTHLFIQRAIDGAGLKGGRMTIVTVGKVDANFGHSLTKVAMRMNVKWRKRSEVIPCENEQKYW